MNIMTRCCVASPVFGVMRMSQMLVAPMMQRENIDRPAEPG